VKVDLTSKTLQGEPLEFDVRHATQRIDDASQTDRSPELAPPSLESPAFHQPPVHTFTQFSTLADFRILTSAPGETFVIPRDTPAPVGVSGRMAGLASNLIRIAFQPVSVSVGLIPPDSRHLYSNLLNSKPGG
jgi:hypothetical protein